MKLSQLITFPCQNLLTARGNRRGNWNFRLIVLLKVVTMNCMVGPVSCTASKSSGTQLRFPSARAHFLIGLLVSPEDTEDIFLRINVSLNCKASQSTRLHSSVALIKLKGLKQIHSIRMKWQTLDANEREIWSIFVSFGEMEGWLLNDSLERKWMEAFVIYFSASPLHFPKRSEENHGWPFGWHMNPVGLAKYEANSLIIPWRRIGRRVLV
jgi:hypothetical protein